MTFHHTLDPEPIPSKVLYINETELADLTIENEINPISDEDQEDNIRVYIPLDINREAILRRLRDIYHRYGSPTSKNEHHFWQETQRVIAHLEIYDQIWVKMDGELENGHSRKAVDVAREIIAILERDKGCAECFAREIIDDLKEEFFL